MSNLVDYAKDELKKIGMVDSGEPYNDFATKAILDLIELFASQGHTGFTAPYVINVFSRLAMFKPLSPLTGEDDEWNEMKDGSFQNKRYSAVFKDTKDGTAYNIDGKAFTDDGEVWYTSRDSRVDVTFPYVVPDKPEYVYRNKEYDSDWTKCSDNHLPDMDVDVLGTSKDGDVLKVTRMKSYFEDAGWEWVLSDDIEGNYYHPDEIIAWMPLPEPYKPQESEEKE